MKLPNLSTFVSFDVCRVCKIAANSMSVPANVLDWCLPQMMWSTFRPTVPTNETTFAPNHFSPGYPRPVTICCIVHYPPAKSFCLRTRNRIRRWPRQSLQQTHFVITNYTLVTHCAMEFSQHSLKSTGLYVSGQLSPMLCVYGTIFSPLPWYTHWPSANM